MFPLKEWVFIPSFFIIAFWYYTITCYQNAVQPYFHYSDGDKSSLSSAEHYLGGKELLALRDILQEDVIDSLKHKGLDLLAIESVQTTLEEVQQLLHSIQQHEIASSLRRNIDFGELGDFCYNKPLNVYKLIHLILVPKLLGQKMIVDLINFSYQ